MRPSVIVLVEPRGDHSAGLFDARKPLSIQHLAAERAVEPLVVSILPRRARIDLDWLDANSMQPSLQRFGDELGPVVGPQVFWFAAFQ